MIKKNYTKFFQYFFNNKEFLNYTYIEILIFINVKIPHICYHNNLLISGNCRLCLGMIGEEKKPTPLCTATIKLNTTIIYNDTKIKKIRENIMEFLLLNHTMDCPACDQAGECDLQDYSYKYGTNMSKYFFNKKKIIINKYKGILIKTTMKRCINCTRCIRFFNEIGNNYLIGTMGRGYNSEISSYVDNLFYDNELSGNVIDLCPVGALTLNNNLSSSNFRIWNLKKKNSIDIFDSIGSLITLYLNGNNLFKITAKIKNKIIYNFISDRIRYIFDNIYKQRILKPLYKINNKYISINWSELNNLLKNKLFLKKKKINIGYYFGDLLNNETIFTASKCLNIVGNSNKYIWNNNLFINNDLNNNYLLYDDLYNFNKKNDLNICFFFGLNLKKEIPLLNLFIKKKYLKNAFKILNISSKINLTYPIYNLGFKFKNIIKFLEGNFIFSKYIIKKKILFFFNIYLLKNEKIFNFYMIFKNIIKNNIINIKENIFNIITSNMDFINKLYLNITSKYKDNINKLKCLIFLNTDNYFNNNFFFKNIFIIYQGHHFNNNINKIANLILPSKFYLQEFGSYINLNGRILKIKEILYSFDKNIKNNISIIYIIFKIIFFKLKTKIITYFKNDKIYYYNPNFFLFNSLIKNHLNLFNNFNYINNYLINYSLNSNLCNFYLNNSLNISNNIMNIASNTLIIKSNYTIN